MTKSFEFLFDVGGPNGYLVHKILPDFCARTGAEARYVPVLLGGLMKATGNQPPMIRYAETPAKLAYERLEFQRFVDAHGLTAFAYNPHFPINTLQIMRGCVAAQKIGVFDAYLNTVMIAMWEEGRNLGDLDILVTTLNQAGLDGPKLIDQSNTAEVKAELIANTENAVARGAFGIPTFFVDGEMFWGKERLAQVEAALVG